MAVEGVIPQCNITTLGRSCTWAERSAFDHDMLAPGPHPFIVGHAHWGEVMQETDSDREARLRELASRLLFTLRKEGSRFCLYREADVPQPVRHDDLTLDEVEETLNTWKLRGPHGG
jgi:hypothetical protein